MQLAVHFGQPLIDFGRVEIFENREQKRWFLDRLLEKQAPDATFEPGYSAIGRILLYSFRPEILTGKRSEGLRH